MTTLTPRQMVRHRKKLKLTQIEVAVKCGVSVAAYRLWEKGGSKPTKKNLARLIKVLELGVSEDDSTSTTDQE